MGRAIALCTGLAGLAGLAGCPYDPRELSDGAPVVDAPPTADARADATTIDASPADADTLFDGLIAWYRMDDLPGGVVPDASGHGHDGSCTSCPEVMAGQIGGAYRFTLDRIDVPAGGELETTAGFTVTAWIQFVSLPGAAYACMVGKQRGGSVFNTWQLCYQASNTRWYFGTQATGTNVVGYTPGPSPGVWYHVAIVWDGEGKALWIDGTKVGTSTQLGIDFDGSAILIGADEDNGSTQQYFDGFLDDVRIYDRDLLDAEIARLSAPP
jgi:large repetitive protein